MTVKPGFEDAETVARPDDATSAVDVPTQAAPELAWAREESSPDLKRPWRSAWRRAGLLVACGMIAAAGVVGWQVFGSIHSAAPPRPTVPAPAAPTTPITAPPAVSPPRPTVQPAPPAPSDSPTLPADQRFLAMLARDGIPRPVSVSDAVAAAADVCLMIKRGDDFGYVESFMVPPKGPFTQVQAEVFVADAVAAYCPHAALP